MVLASRPQQPHVSLAGGTASVVLATAALRDACFSLSGAVRQHSISADCSSPHKQASAGRGPEPIEKQLQMGMAMGTLRAGLGACLILWSSRLVHARTRARAGGIRRCAATSDAPAATSDEPVATATESAGSAAGFDISLQSGVLAPYGEPGVSYWDPLGLAKNIDADTWRQYRKAELKHGRVSMLAMVGLLAQHSNRIPGMESVVPNGIGAAEPGTFSSSLLGIAVISAGIIELNLSDEGREPGDFGDPADLQHTVGGDMANMQKMDWQNFELSHSRLAMLGVIGTLVAEYVTGLDGIEQWGRLGAAKARTMALLFPEGRVPELSSF